MKKPVTMRLDPELLAAAQALARRDNRSLTNLIETILKKHVESSVTTADPLKGGAVGRHDGTDRTSVSSA